MALLISAVAGIGNIYISRFSTDRSSETRRSFRPARETDAGATVGVLSDCRQARPSATEDTGQRGEPGRFRDKHRVYGRGQGLVRARRIENRPGVIDLLLPICRAR